MRYHSFSSNRTKNYEVHPYRVIYAQGGLYLFAYVPEYEQVRTFAVERIKRLTMLERSFEKVTELEPEAFPHSLGVNRGDPEPVSIEFSPRIARYVTERTWHPSQRVRTLSDGSVVLDLHVCHDWALRSWIHSFGPFVRVRSPSALADQILDDLEEARTQYAPHMDFEIPASLFDESLQARLPLGRGAAS